MSSLNSNASNPVDTNALLLTLANLEQDAKYAAKALLLLDGGDSNGAGVSALIRSIQRKADALRIIQQALTV